jgi:AcrR family transcriptional regulator
MSATEKLVAEYGIEAVNLRDVGREADQRNNSVVQYHFGTKEILVGAVLDARVPALDARYRALLDELEQSGRLREPGALATAFVDPLLELDQAEEDRCFLGFLAAMLTAPHWAPLLVDREDFQSLFQRVKAALTAAGIPDAAVAGRLRLAWLMLVVSLAGRDREMESETVRAELLDAVTGLLGAPNLAGAGSR